jgi:hypothetical protein
METLVNQNQTTAVVIYQITIRLTSNLESGNSKQHVISKVVIRNKTTA